MYEFDGTNDIVFKLMFSDKIVVASLLSSLLQIPVEPEEISLKSNEVNLSTENKSTRFDVRCELFSNKLDIDLEMQKNNPNYDIKRRMIYYLGQLISQNSLKGKDFMENDVCCIFFLNFSLFENNTCVYRFKMVEEESKEILPGATILIIELPKKEFCDKIEIRQWIDIIEGKTIESTNKGMIKGMEKLRDINSDELMKEQLRQQRNRENEDRVNLEATLQIGLERGIEEGRKEGKKEIILKLFKKGYSVEEISFMTDLSEKQINELLNNQ